MTSTRVVWAAVMAVLCWTLPGSVQAMTQPRLVPADTQTILQPGDTLRVTCLADRPVTWNYTSLAQGTSRAMQRRMRKEGIKNISSRVSIVDDIASGGDYSHASRLEIRDVTYLEVGYQSCQFVGASSLDSAARVYLFVNDSNHLLVSEGPIISVTLSQNRRGVIPCRPSHPGVKVTLKKDFHSQVYPGNQSAFTWDERSGFVVSRAEMQQTGAYKCETESSTEHSIVFVLVAAATESVQQPSIDTSDARQNAVLGYNFSLECSVHFETGQKLVLAWDVPAASTGLKTGRMASGEEFKSSDGQKYVSQLLVTDTQPEDNGTYTCRVEDHNGHANSQTVHVNVHSPNVSIVQLRTDVSTFSMRLGGTVKIVANVESRPSPEVAWYDPEKKEIITDPGKYFVMHTSDQTILEVLDLRLQDMGVYRVKATARSEISTATDQLTFNVTVSDRARVQLGTGQWYYMASERYQLTCTATGYPTPSLIWRFQPCTSRSCQETFGSQTLAQPNGDSETQVPSAPYLVQSTLDITANTSGYYQCYANNTESDDPDSAQQRFFVSDIAGGFGIQRSNGSVIAGDNVTMSCGGSMLDFTSPANLSWHWSRTEYGASTPATNLPGVQVREETTEYSYRKVLVLDPVKMDHAGLLHCTGVDLRGAQNRTSTWLGVIASQKPVFTPEANMDQSASLQMEEGGGVELNCTVAGRPTPTVTWTKDGAKLQLDGSNRIRLLGDGDQRLVISTVLSSDAGNYACRAANRDGAVMGSAELVVPGDDTVTLVVVPVVVVFGLLLVGLVICLVVKSRQQQGLQRKLTRLELETFHSGRVEQINPDLPIDEQAELLPYDQDEWEFPKDRLILGRQIGSGAFGRVLKAEAIGLTSGQQRTVVAVKMPKSGSDPDQIRSLMSELKIMIQLGKHLNVVNLLGAVTKDAVHGEFMVLVEYCRHGNLHQYLHRHKNSFINQVHPISGEYDPTLGEEEFHAAMRRDSASESAPLNYASLERGSDGRLTLTPGLSCYQTPRRGSTASSVNSAVWNTDGTTADDSVCQSPCPADEERVRFNTLSGGGTAGRRPRRTPLTTRDLLRWGYQVARGMEYLASRKLLHGDLAARNILLAEDNIVKISDFGLSRDIYKTKDYRKKGKGLLPVKWMAIESIQESIFSTQSDVWAFGVVMWELFSLGATPYPGMEYDVNFVRRLRDGYRMEAPKFSPNATYQLMLDCWREMPGDRPSFTELSDKLGRCLEDQVKKDYIQLNAPYQVTNADYFARRTDYVNTLVSPDYQNVTPRGDPVGSGSDEGSQGSQEGVSIMPGLQAVGYTAPVKDGRDPSPAVDADSYLLMSPGPELSPDEGIFSPRPTAIVRPSAHFEFPPAPQVARESPPPTGFYNPSYHEAGKGRVPSTPKMGTRVSRAPRPAAPAAAAEDEEHYRSPLPSSGDGEHFQFPSPGAGEEHYRVPVPVGCEQLA